MPQEPKQEHERKFVIRRLPSSLPEEVTELVQVYTGNEDPKLEMRCRREDDQRYLVFKLDEGDGGSRDETDPPLDLTNSPRIFDYLATHWVLPGYTRIRKDRYQLDHGPEAKEFSLDVYFDQLVGHFVIEVEFFSAEDMAAWKIPTWMVELGATEVTHDKRYKNKSLAKNGWPEE